MKQHFNKLTLLAICLLLCSVTVLGSKKPKQEMYQLTVYQYTTAQQEATLDSYLKDALLPALHKNGYKNIGVFKSLANDTAKIKTMFVYMPVKNVADQLLLTEKLNKDTAYQSAGAAYLNAVYTAPPYSRMEIILLKAFHLAPQMQLPMLTAPKSERVYELRSYESASEKIFKNIRAGVPALGYLLQFHPGCRIFSHPSAGERFRHDTPVYPALCRANQRTMAHCSCCAHA